VRVCRGRGGRVIRSVLRGEMICNITIISKLENGGKKIDSIICYA